MVMQPEQYPCFLCEAKFLHYDTPDGEMVFILGGRRNGAPLNETRPLDTVEVSSKNVFFEYVQCIFLCCNQVYDRFTNRWLSQPSMLQSRVGCGAASHNGKVYVIGGWTGYHNREVKR